jgi:hypothetical protein
MVLSLRRLDDPDREADRQTASLAALALLLGLVVASLFLVDRLRIEADRQDCLLAGQARCFLPGQ